MKLRQPSAGNERIRPDELRRITKGASDTIAVLDDEGIRALAWAREHEGYASAAATDPSRGGDISDPTGNAAMRPDLHATQYERLVHGIKELEMASKILDQILGEVRQSNLDADQEHKLERINATTGICDACSRYHDPSRGDRDDRLKPTNGDRMYGPDCYSAWQREQQKPNPATRQVFERQRGKGVEPTTEDVA